MSTETGNSVFLGFDLETQPLAASIEQFFLFGDSAKMEGGGGAFQMAPSKQ